MEKFVKEDSMIKKREQYYNKSNDYNQEGGLGRP
jgi:hypothetical protein